MHGFDLIPMVRIALMNAVLHGIDKPDIQYTDTLSKAYEEKKSTRLYLLTHRLKAVLIKVISLTA